MKNIIILFLFTVVAGLAILKGSSYTYKIPVKQQIETTDRIPYIGRLQILNGCGIGGAAHTVAEYLRFHNFDVKNIGNAENWNFTETLIISRFIDTTIAQQVALALLSKNMVLIRTQETRYDVTVIVGNDYRERMQ